MKYKFIKILLATLSFNTFLGNYSYSYFQKHDSSTIKQELKKSYSNSSDFKLIASFSEPHINNSKKTCYYYYNADVYSCPFTSVSNLILINVNSTFVPGNVPVENGDSSYNKDHHLKDGYIHILPHRISEGSNTSPSFVIKDAWPKSSTSKVSITTSFGGTYNFSSTLSAGISMDSGAYIEGDLTHGLSLSYSKSTSETTDDPKLSQQLNSNGTEEQFRFEYHIEGTNSYNLNTYTLLEVKKDAIGFNKESIVFEVDAYLRTVSWHNTWWEGHYEISDSLIFYANLGHYPSNPKFID